MHVRIACAQDLDACSGRYGVTPDSNGEVVYYYMVTDAAPFTVGCFGPNDDGSVVTVEQCRALYRTCGNGDETEVPAEVGNAVGSP